MNGKVAKPGTGLKLEDEITIFTPAYKIVVRVKSLSEKERGEELYEVIKKERLEE